MNARVLIIEDNPANLELMRFLLQAFGFTLFTAADGPEGIETARCDDPRSNRLRPPNARPRRLRGGQAVEERAHTARYPSRGGHGLCDGRRS